MWVWEYPTEAEEGEDGEEGGEAGHHDLYMDIGEEIRFRVTSETFVDTSPCTEPKAEPAAGAPSGEPGTDATQYRAVF